MAPSSKAAALKAKAAQNAVREKVFHPNSRKAGKLERAGLRISKLATQTSVRSKQQIAKVDRAGFFYLALPPDAPSLTLEELHELVSSVWITRHNEAIKAEESRRRKGEPRRPREVALREQQLRDVEEYRTGLELPDLTDESTVALFRQWGGVDTSYLHLLRTIRISSSNTKMVQVVKCGLQKQQRPVAETSETFTGTADNVAEGMNSTPEGADSVLEGANNIVEGMDNIPEGTGTVPEGANALETMDNFENPQNVVETQSRQLDTPDEQRTWLSGFPDIPLSNFSSTIQTMDCV